MLERCIEIPEEAANEDVFNMLTEIANEIERNEPSITFIELNRWAINAHCDAPFEMRREEEGR